MASIETTVEIERPRSEVFEYMTDLSNAKEWNTELVSRSYDGDAIRVGSTGVDEFRMGRRLVAMPWRVTEYLPPQRLVIEFSGTFAATAIFSFEESRSGTVLRCRTALRPRGLWRLAAPMMAREGRRADHEQFHRAKGILEQRDPRSPTRPGSAEAQPVRKE